MGMFDDVEYEMDCPNCGERVTGFQSKDLECTMAKVSPLSVRRFYSSCRSCKSWIEFQRDGDGYPEYGSMEDFKMTVTSLDDMRKR